MIGVHVDGLARAAVDRDTGREWIEKELSRPEYSANDLTPLERLGRWVGDAWTALLSAALGGNSPWMLLLVALALAVIVGLIVWRVRRLGLRRTSLPPTAFDALVAAPHPEPWRESARAAAARGDHRRAVVDQARALFAVLAARHIIDLDSASTAREIAGIAGSALPERAGDLDRVATVFNDLVFGPGAEPDPTESTAGRRLHPSAELSRIYREFVDLDAQLSRLQLKQVHG